MGIYAEHVLPRIVNVARWHEVGRRTSEAHLDAVRALNHEGFQARRNARLTPEWKLSGFPVATGDG